MERTDRDSSSPVEEQCPAVLTRAEVAAPQKKRRRRQGVEKKEDFSDDSSEIEVKGPRTPVSSREFKSLCRPSSITRVFTEFSDEQKQAVEDIGFGGLLSMSLDKTPLDLYGWMLDAFNPTNQIVYVDSKPIFHVISDDVRDIFMLPNNVGKPVLGSNAGPECAALREAWEKEYGLASHGRYPVSKIQKHMKRLDKGCADFKRLFVLYALSVFLAPTTNRMIRVGVLSSLVNVSEIPNLDWCGYIMQCLCSSVHTWQKGNSIHVGGCIMILQVCYLQRSLWKGQRIPRSLPLIQHYDCQTVFRIINGELMSGGFGRGIFVLEGYPISKQVNGHAEYIGSDLKSDSSIGRIYPDEFERSVAKASRDFEMFCRRQLPRLMETKHSIQRSQCVLDASGLHQVIDRMINALHTLKGAVMDQENREKVVHPVPDAMQPDLCCNTDKTLVLLERLSPRNELNAEDISEGCYTPEPVDTVHESNNVPEIEWVIPDVDVLGGEDQPDRMELVEDSERQPKNVRESEVVDALFDDEDRHSGISEGTQNKLNKFVQSLGSDLLYGGETEGHLRDYKEKINSMEAELSALQTVNFTSKLFQKIHPRDISKLKRHEAIVVDFCISKQNSLFPRKLLFSDGRVCLGDALDFTTLDDGEVISSVIINALARTVNSSKPKPSKPRMFCLDVIPHYSSLFASSVAFTLWDETLKISDRDFLCSEMVMVPVRIHGHYFAVVANMNKSKFQYLDNETHVDTIDEWLAVVASLRDLISGYMLKRGHHKAGEVAFYDVETVQGSWRTDSGNCDSGIYVMHHMSHFRGDDMVENDALNLPLKRDEFRAKICAKMISSQANVRYDSVLAAVLEHHRESP